MSLSKADFISQARPVAEDLVKHAKTAGKAFGITDAHIQINAEKSEENTIEKSDVTAVTSGSRFYVMVTLFAGDRVLSFTKSSLNKTELSDAMDQNMKVIQVVPENPERRLLESAKVYKGTKADFDLYDQTPPDRQKLIDYAKAMEQAAMAQPNVKATSSTDAATESSHVFILATNGLEYQKSVSGYQVVVQPVAENAAGEMQTDHDYSVAVHFGDMADPAETGANAGKAAGEKLGAVVPATGTMPVVLCPDAATGFFYTVYKAIDGGKVHTKTTFMRDRIGQQVMSAGITLEDDPLIPRASRSGTIDSSGQKMEKITFIDKGILKSYNVDLQKARQLGIPPIGRNDRITSSRIVPGLQTPDDLISDIKEGVYVLGFKGGIQDVNNGTYSCPAYGKLIKDGKITDTAIDGFVVSGNLKDMFMNVTVANDTPPLPNTRSPLAAPTTRINGLTIAGA